MVLGFEPVLPSIPGYPGSLENRVRSLAWVRSDAAGLLHLWVDVGQKGQAVPSLKRFAKQPGSELASGAQDAVLANI